MGGRSEQLGRCFRRQQPTTQIATDREADRLRGKRRQIRWYQRRERVVESGQNRKKNGDGEEIITGIIASTNAKSGLARAGRQDWLAANDDKGLGCRYFSFGFWWRRCVAYVPSSQTGLTWGTTDDGMARGLPSGLPGHQ